MLKNIFLLFISGALVFASCSKARFAGAGKYKIHAKVDGDSAFINGVEVQYWDSKYNNHKIESVEIPKNATDFTSPEYSVGKAIVVNVDAANTYYSRYYSRNGNYQAKQVHLVVELLKNGKVIRRGEGKDIDKVNIILKTPLENK